MAKKGAVRGKQGQKPLAELKARLLFVLMAILVYRIGAHIPVPGIDPAALKQMFDSVEGNILDMFNMFSGGSLERMSILALGVIPYISASIIMQLMTAVTPQLEQLKKEGEAGRRKITQWTRYLTLVLGVIQGYAMSSMIAGQAGVVYDVSFAFFFVATLSLATGTMFLMWLGEQVTERGIGNGISLLIFAGIVAGLPGAIGQSFIAAREGEINILGLLLIAFIAVAVTGFIVFIERGQYRIKINYPNRQQGNKMMAGGSSYLPLKVNTAGVIPAIFASTLLLFPATLGQWFGQSEGMGWIQTIGNALGPGQPLNIILFSAGIIFFCFFYTSLMFNPREMADNLKRSNAFIRGIRPGKQTSEFIDRVMTPLTLIGAIYMVLVCLMPQFLVVYWNVPFYLGGTSLLIVVVVVMDFMAQIQSHFVSHQYASLMDKSKINSHGRGGLLK